MMSSSPEYPSTPPEPDKDSQATDPATESIFGDETLLERMGGWQGLVYSTLPVVVFVPVNAWKGLSTALIAALTTATLILLYRIVRKQKLTPAVSGFIAVALCAYIAYRMGDAKGYYLWGIWISALYGAAFLLSIVVRWPLIGVLWNALNGHSQGWRKDRNARLWYSLATAAWAIVFAARFVVQQWLYEADAATALGVTRILMGWPLTLLVVAVTVVLVRKATVSEEDTLPPQQSQLSATETSDGGT